jgi:hypothetical protein
MISFLYLIKGTSKNMGSVRADQREPLPQYNLPLVNLIALIIFGRLWKTTILPPLHGRSHCGVGLPLIMARVFQGLPSSITLTKLN